MIRSNLLISIVVLMAASMSAQQDPQFTQWYMDHTTSNIAAAGQTNLTNVNGFYRNQWVGLDKAPVTTLFNLDGKLGFMPGAFGIQFYSDELGPENNTMVKLGYAYSLAPFSGGTVMSFGTSVSYFSKKLGNDWISTDPWQDDLAIPDDQMTASAIDLDFGFYMHNQDKFYLGISSTHLLQSDLAQMSITPARHYYAMTGYNFALDGDFLVLRTNFLAKSDMNATAIDFNVNLLIAEMIWIGASWRPGDAVSPVAGLQHRIVKKDAISYNEQLFRLGYSYDITTSELQTFSSGSHEVFLSYSFKFESTPIQNRYANPRFL
jgi:type IX secretion system PorP/SprF family membrane protein